MPSNTGGVVGATVMHFLTRFARAMPAALLGCVFSVCAPAESGIYRNETLVEDTSDFSVGSWKPVTAEDLPNHGELVTLSPQNRGVLLYADEDIALFNRGNVRTNETTAGGKSVSRVIPEGPVCSVGTWHREWSSTGDRLDVAPVQVPKMHVVAVINKPPTFELTADWIEAHLHPLIREKLVADFCGGKIVTVRADIWLAGVQHSGDGTIFNVADAQYPQYRVGDDARRRRSFEVIAGTQRYRVNPFRAGFASASFDFWSKLAADDRDRLDAMGFDVSDAESVRASIAYGVAAYRNGRIEAVNKGWSRLAYADYVWHVSEGARHTAGIREARKKAEEAAKAFVSALAIMQFRGFCSGRDTPWWAWDLHDVWRRRDLDACKHYFEN